MSSLIKRITIAKGTKTPIAATLARVAGDLGQTKGPKILVLVTDGQESCKGDPEQAIRDLIATGLDVRVNIVGFAIDDADLKAQLEHWAEVGHGQAFDAQGSSELAAGIATALRAPFQVYDEADGQLVGSGVVGGDPVQVPPGTYRVEVLTDPTRVLQASDASQPARPARSSSRPPTRHRRSRLVTTTAATSRALRVRRPRAVVVAGIGEVERKHPCRVALPHGGDGSRSWIALDEPGDDSDDQSQQDDRRGQPHDVAHEAAVFVAADARRLWRRSATLDLRDRLPVELLQFGFGLRESCSGLQRCVPRCS